MEGENKCCKCEEFKWPDPQETVWPSNGPGYCIFHAPKARKWNPSTKAKCTVEEFNDLVHARIDSLQHAARKTNQKPFNCFAGAVFPGSISFSKYDEDNPMDCASFADAEFCEEVDFSSTMFSGSVAFKRTQFRKNADFIRAVFVRDVSFVGAHFFADVEFLKAEFNQESNFACSKFDGAASLFGVTFTGMTSFDEASLNRTARFQTSKFVSGGTFYKTAFREKAYFNSVELGKMVRFSDCIAEDKALLLYNLSRNSLSNLWFTHHELPIFFFMGCRWPDHLATEVVGQSDPDNLLRCEELYRAMKQRAVEEHDQLQASRWHYREKLMAMKRGGSSAFEQAMLWVYFACSGFGERAGQALLVLLALVVLSFVLNATPQPMDWNTLWGAAAANATMATIPFAKDIPGEGWVKVGRGFWQFLIAVQFTLFALAVRNRFRR